MMRTPKEIKIGEHSLEEILSMHEDSPHRLNLTNADLHSVELPNANLKFAELHNADLRNASLYCSNLSHVNLCCADLRGAYLYSANLFNTYMCRSDLRDANLYNANLRYANLSGADLRGTDFSCADLTNTDLSDSIIDESTLIFVPIACPSEGSFIGWKKVYKYIIKLLIPKNAKRSSATTNKCRCDRAKVLEIQNFDGTLADITMVENHNYSRCVYEVNKMVYPDSFDTNRWNECSHGIHFFIDRESAVRY